MKTMLQQHLSDGIPWPVEIGDTLQSQMVNQILPVFKELGFRKEVFNHSMCEGGELDINPVFRRHLQGRSREDDPKPVALLTALRAQFEQATSNFGEELSRKLKHIWQVQLAPTIIRQRMRSFWGWTLLPGRRKVRFSHGERFLDVSHAKFLTITPRRHQMKENFIVDMFDIKIHDLCVDPSSNLVIIGGRNRGEDLTVMARYFNFAPTNKQNDRAALPANNVSAFEGGLAVHEAIEKDVVSFAHPRNEPSFPEVRLGFASVETVTPDLESEALREDALTLAQQWFRAGKPASWEVDEIPTALEHLNSLPRDWGSLVDQIGVMQEMLLCRTFLHNIVNHDGLALVPLRYFGLYSPQDPVRKAMRIFLHLEPHLMGRDCVSYDGEVTPDDLQFRPQVVQFPKRVDKLPPDLQPARGLAGRQPGWEYDFSLVPTGLERFFRDLDD